MRKVKYGAAVSLDGYLAGPGEAMDWLRFTPDAAEINQESWRGVDTMLMGRKTYEFAARNGSARAGPANLRSYVFSRTLAQVSGAELVSTDATSFVRGLKETAGGDILVMGGGVFASALIEAGLVDELSLNVHPLLLGDGAPMFREMAGHVELRLVECRQLAEQCVFFRYAVQAREHPSGPRRRS